MWLLKKIVDLFIYGSFWIAACAAALAAQSLLILNHKLYSPALTSLVFFGTLLLYALHRIVGISKVHEFEEEVERYKVIATYKNHIIVYATIGLVGSIISFWYVSFKVKAGIFFPALVSLGYVLPVLAQKKRLRDVNHIKIYLVSIIWAWVTVILPALEQRSLPLDAEVWIMALERACFIFAITLPFDIRDLNVDAFVKVKTIPAVVGVYRTKVIAISLLFGAWLLVMANFQMGFYPFAVLVALSISFAGSALLLYFSDRFQHDYYFGGLLDGTMIFQFLLIYFSFHNLR